MADYGAYNASLDTTSLGAQHRKAYEEFKRDGQIGGNNNEEEEGKKYGKKYDNVWTKEPHGGKYKLVGNKDGYDALECDSSGTLVVREPGYEKPMSGPTTNFVGNHMMQGAIDLVQSELVRQDPRLAVRQMRLDAARGIVREPPKLLAVEMRPAAALAAATGRALHTYRWEDVGARVLVTVPLQGMEAEVPMEGVRCEFHEAGFSVRLATPEVGGATLNVPRLYAAVIPDQCTHTLSAGKLQLSLVKADASGAAWPTLRGQDPVKPQPKLLEAAHSVDLLELRKMTIRQREGRLAAKLPAVMAESTAVALPAPPGAEHEAACGPPPEGADVTSARAEATEAFKAGRYEDAIQWYTWALVLLRADGTDEDGSVAAVLYTNRATCAAQLERHSAVLRDCTEAVSRVDSAKPRLRRALAHEALQQFAQAADDFRAALALDPSAKEEQRLAKHAAETAARCGPGAGGMPTLVKPCLPQFEVRGKAGAAF